MRISDWSSDVCSSDLNAGDTGTAADKALKAIVVAEVEQTVDHEAERVRIASQIGVTSKATGATGGRRDARGRETARLDVGFTETDFDFRAETAEIVTDGAFDIVASTMIERTGIVDGTDIAVQVLDAQARKSPR